MRSATAVLLAGLLLGGCHAPFPLFEEVDPDEYEPYWRASRESPGSR